MAQKPVASGQWPVASEPGGRSYRDLLAWRKAMELVAAVYRNTGGFPASERFGLTNQLRRCAVSIPSNVAEGQGRLTSNEFHHFLGIARGSLMELETQLLIARNLGYLRDPNLNLLFDLASEVGRLLNGLMNSLRRRSA